MVSGLNEFERQALQLSMSDRARLAELLIESLDEADAAETERLWVEEAERRYREYKAGRVSSRSTEDVLRDARTTLK